MGGDGPPEWAWGLSIPRRVEPLWRTTRSVRPIGGRNSTHGATAKGHKGQQASLAIAAQGARLGRETAPAGRVHSDLLIHWDERDLL